MARHQRSSEADHARKPDDPSDLHPQSWKGAIKRAGKEFLADDCLDWAAALTYYAVLALFPAIIALISIVRLVTDPQQVVDALLGIVERLGPESAVETFRGPVEALVQGQGAVGLALVVGLLGALWSASGYVSAFSRASNAIYEVEEGRPFWKLRPMQLLITLVCIVLVAVVAIGLVVTGPLAQAVGDVIGLGDTAVTVWQIAKWPVMIAIVILIISILYYSTPNVKQPKFKWITFGGLIALVVWVLASVAFAFYVANFGNYNATYGTLGAVISFLVWLWITNIAILFGAEFDAELERGRELQAGVPGAEEEIQLPPREAKKEKG